MDLCGQKSRDRLLTCSSMVQPICFNSGQRAMDSMAAVATSAALPWMGVLIAARKACPCHTTLLSATLAWHDKCDAQKQNRQDTVFPLQLEPCLLYKVRRRLDGNNDCIRRTV